LVAASPLSDKLDWERRHPPDAGISQQKAAHSDPTDSWKGERCVRQRGV